VAVLTLSAGGVVDDQHHARELEWCLPSELTANHVPIVAPERLMTLQTQTGGALDKDSARAVGLAVGARWVVYGNIVTGTANLFVASVLDDRVVYSDSFRADDPKSHCVSFAKAAAERLATEAPPHP
jgi:hypothetical protein